MPACTFFGHRDCPGSVRPRLRETLVDLIENHAVDMFYVGRQGAFDAMVRSVLKELILEYPHIRYAVVLERIPGKRNESDPRDYSDTMLPERYRECSPTLRHSMEEQMDDQAIRLCRDLHHPSLGWCVAVCPNVIHTE